MRELYLMNDIGEIYYFSYKNNTLVSSISGLGFTRELTYQKFKSKYSKVKEENPKSDINLTLVFLDGYAGYSSFLSYLSKSKSLKLYYKSVDLKYCDVEIPSMSKTELIANTLQCDTKIDKLSLWQKDVISVVNVEEEDNKKTYPYSYPYTYSRCFEGKVNVINNGSEQAYVKIEISGAVIDPEVIITKNGIEVSKLKLYVKSNNCLIVVDSNLSNQYMKMIEDGVETDIYQYQDFTEDNFLFIPPGSYDIEFKPGVSDKTTCKITYTESYLGN